MPSIADLRAANPWAEDYSDIELLNMRAEQVGVSLQDAAGAFGVQLPKSNTSANLKSGGHGYLANLGSVGAALGLSGAQEFADSQKRQSELYDSLSTAPKSFDEVHGLGDFVGYAGRLGAQSLPYAAEFAATAGLGGFAMRGTRAAITAAEAAGDVSAATVARAALARGTTTAGVVGSYPSAVGDVLSNQYEQAGKYDGAYAAAAGVPYAALNAFGVDGMLTRGLTKGLGKGLTNSRLANAGIMGGVTGLSEGLGETGQELFNQYGRTAVDQSYDPMGAEAQKQYKESFIGGALLGGMPGGMGGLMQRKLSAGSDLLNKPQQPAEPEFTLGSQQLYDPVGPNQFDKAAYLEQVNALRDESRRLGLLLADRDLMMAKPIPGQPNPPGHNTYVQAIEAKRKVDAQLRELTGGAPINEPNYGPDLFSNMNPAPPAPFVPRAVPNLVTENQPLQQRIDANLGVNGTGTSNNAASFNAAMQAPTGHYGVDPNTGHEFPITGQHQIDSLHAHLPATAEMLKQQMEQQQAAKAQAELEAKVNHEYVAKKYGLETVRDDKNGEGHWKFLDKDHFKHETLAPVMDKLVAQEREKSDTVREVEDALQEGGSRMKPAALRTLAATLTGSTMSRTAENINARIKSLAEAGKGADHAELSRLASAYETLVGVEAPAYALTQKNDKEKGTQNGLQTKETVTSKTGQQGQTSTAVTPKEQINQLLQTGSNNKSFAVALADSGVKLSPKQLDVVNYVENKLRNNEADDVIDSEGVFKHAEIAAELGVERGSVGVPLKAIRDNIVKESGMSLQEIKGALKQREIENRKTEESEQSKLGLSPEKQTSVVEGDDVFGENGSMQIINSVGGSSGDVGGNSVQPTATDLAKADPVHEKRVAEAAERREASIQALLNSEYSGEAAQDWDDMRSQDVPESSKLDRGTAVEWTYNFIKMKRGEISADELDTLQKTLEGELRGVHTAIAEPIRRESGNAVSDNRSEGISENTQTTSASSAVSSQRTDDNAAGSSAAEAKQGVAPTVKKKGKAKLSPDAVWASLAEEHGLPALEELHPETQADWLMAKKHDLATANRVFNTHQALLEEEKQSKKRNKTEQPVEESEDDDFESLDGELKYFHESGNGKSIDISEANLLTREEISAQSPNIANAISTYDKLGIGHALDSVDVWAVTEKMEASDGIYQTMSDGRQGVMFHQDAVEGSLAIKPEEVVHHEIGHAIDMIGYGGVYSAQPEFMLTVNNGKVKAIGKVAKEMQTLYNSNPLWRGLLEYPFNAKRYDKLTNDPGRVRGELFAQLWAAFLDPDLREALHDSAPVTFKFLTEVLNDIRATKTFSEKTEESAERRATEFAAIRNPELVQELLSSRANGQGGSSGTGGTTFDRVSKHQRLTSSEVAEAIGGDTAQQLVDDTSHLLKKGLGSVTYLHDLVERFKDTLKSVKPWYEEILKHQVDKVRREREAEAIASMADKLSDSEYKRVNEFIGDSTFNQEWGYQPTWRSDKPVTVDPDMAHRWNALTRPEQKVVDAIFHHGYKVQGEKYKLLKKIGVSDLMQRQGNMDGPYAPLLRFGNHVGIVKSKELAAAEKAEVPDNKLIDTLKADPKHYQMRMFDTMGQAKKFVRTAGDHYAVRDAFEGAEQLDKPGNTNYKMLQKVMAHIKADQTLPRQARTAMESFINDMYLNSLAEHSARQQGRKRNFRAGYDSDMVKSFLSNARANASFMSNLEHGEKINEHMLKMRKEAKDENTGLHSGQDAYNQLAAHYADAYNYKPTPIQDRLVGLTSAWQLSTSIGYHIANAMQGVMVTLPKLAADFNNYGGAWKHLVNGYTLFKQIATGATVDLSKIKDKGLREALQHASDLGDLDVGMEENLSHFNRTRTGYGAIDTASNVMSSVMHKLRQVSRMVETMNRVSAGSAAYNMAIAHGKTEAQAKDYVISVLKTTQGDFSRTGAPLLLKKLPKVMTQYRKFQLMMAAVYAKAYYQAFHGATAEEKALGKRMLMFKLFHTSVGAGVLGWPMMNIATLAYAAIGKMWGDDEPWDLETDARAAIGDKTTADLLLHGPMAMIGVDMSAKLGEDKIFSILPYNDFDFSSGKKALQTVGALASGPSGAQLGRFIDGINYIQEGNLYKGAEKLMPKGIASAMESFRLANEGYTIRNGDVLVKPEDVSSFGLMLNSMGLPSTAIQDIKRMNAHNYEVVQYFTDRTKEIEQDYYKAAKEKDGAEMADLRKQFMELQAAKDRQRKLLGGSSDFLKRQQLSTLIMYPQRHEKAMKAKELHVES